LNARRSSGFTLIEMVIAFAILGLTLTVLYNVFENALSRSRRDARLSESILVAQSLLARAGVEWPLAEGTRAGEWNGFSYQLAVQANAPGGGQHVATLQTAHITATVVWPEAAGRRGISLSALKFLTPESP
jgi:general secretion pathway protein I